MANASIYKYLKRDFLAQGDGVTDDTEEIKQFLDYLAVNGGTGIVESGVYLLSSYSRSNSTSETDMPFNIIGMGTEQSIFKSKNDKTLFKWNMLEGITIKNIKLDCQYSKYSPAGNNRKHGMMFINCQNILVENCSVVDFCGTGIIGYTDTEESGIIYRNIKIKNCYTQATRALEDYSKEKDSDKKRYKECNGILIADYWESEISGCTAEDMSFFGVELKNNACWNRVTNCSVINCHYGFGMGQTTLNNTGCENNIFDSILVKDCIVGCIMGKAKNNNISNVLMDFANLDANNFRNAIAYQLKSQNNSVNSVNITGIPVNRPVVMYESGSVNNYTSISYCSTSSSDTERLFVVKYSNDKNSVVVNNYTLLYHSLSHGIAMYVSGSEDSLKCNKAWYMNENMDIPSKS